MEGYGFCPICGAPGKMRERRMNGNDVCENKHTYPSASATETSDVMIGRWQSKANPEVQVEVVADYRGFLLVGYTSASIHTQAYIPQLMEKAHFTNWYKRV